MKEIKLGRSGKTAIVDDRDFPKVSKVTWRLHQLGYVYRVDYENGVRGSARYLHRVILACPKGLYVDHINRNKLDNRRENLRVTTNSLNCLNGKMRKNNTSGYKGIIRQGERWVVRIMVGRTNRFIGSYKEIEAAIIARQAVDKFLELTEALPTCGP